jgi:hypothetical protein
MIFICGEISLEMFGGSADHDFYQRVIQFELLPSPWLIDGRDSTIVEPVE